MPYTKVEKDHAWDEIDLACIDSGLTMEKTIIFSDGVTVSIPYGFNADVGRLCLKCFLVRDIHTGRCSRCRSDEYLLVSREDFQ